MKRRKKMISSYLRSRRSTKYFEVFLLLFFNGRIKKRRIYRRALGVSEYSFAADWMVILAFVSIVLFQFHIRNMATQKHYDSNDITRRRLSLSAHEIYKRRILHSCTQFKFSALNNRKSFILSNKTHNERSYFLQRRRMNSFRVYRISM